MTPPSQLEAIPVDLVRLVAAQEPQVRVAKPEDEADLLAMLRRRHRENPQPFPMSEEMVRETVLRTITPNRNAPDAGESVCAIIGEPGSVEASIGLVVTNLWWSQEPFLGALWFHVVPEYRRYSHARALILFARNLADALQMNLRIGTVIREGQKAVADDRLWKRHLGGEWRGSSYLYSPTVGGM